jgi:hypothetical protein
MGLSSKIILTLLAIAAGDIEKNATMVLCDELPERSEAQSHCIEDIYIYIYINRNIYIYIYIL